MRFPFLSRFGLPEQILDFDRLAWLDDCFASAGSPPFLGSTRFGPPTGLPPFGTMNDWYPLFFGDSHNIGPRSRWTVGRNPNFADILGTCFQGCQNTVGVSQVEWHGLSGGSKYVYRGKLRRSRADR